MLSYIGSTYMTLPVGKRSLPDADDCIVLAQGPGRAPDVAVPIDRPQLVIYVRHLSPATADTVADALAALLHGVGEVNILGTRIYSISFKTKVSSIETAARGPRHIRILTFDVERQRTLEASP